MSDQSDSEGSHCSASGNVSDCEIEHPLSKAVTFEFVCGLGGDTVRATLAPDISFGHMHNVLRKANCDPEVFVNMLLGDEVWKDPTNVYAKFCDDVKVRKLIRENGYRLKVLLLKAVTFVFAWGLGGETLPLILPPNISVGRIHDILKGSFINPNVSATLLIGDDINIDLDRCDERIYDDARVRKLLLEDNNCLSVQVMKHNNKRMKDAPSPS